MNGILAGNNEVREAREADHILERMETLAAKAEELQKKAADRLCRLIKCVPMPDAGTDLSFSNAASPLFEQMSAMINRINYHIDETMSVINRTEV